MMLNETAANPPHHHPPTPASMKLILCRVKHLCFEIAHSVGRRVAGCYI